MRSRVNEIYKFIKKFNIPYSLIGKEMGYHHSYLTRVFTEKVKITRKFYISLEYWLKNFRDSINKEISKIFIEDKEKE